MEKKPYPNYYDLNPEEYGGLLEALSYNRRISLKNQLEIIEKEWGDKVALIFTGSDGKRERHPQSKT